VSRDYIKDSLVNPVLARLEELKNIAQINYAIAQMITGGTNNLQKSVNTIKGITEKSTRAKEEKKMFPMTEIRLQALTDLLAAFGHPDTLISNRNEPFYGYSNLPELESPILLTNIDKVLISDQVVSHCELIVLFDDDDADEFVLLDKVLGGILKLDKSKFVNDVCQAYNDGVEPVKSCMKEIIRKELHLDIKGWKNSFLIKKHSLTLEYLPVLSKIYDLIFKLCTVTSHRDYNHVFLPTGEVFHFSEGTTTATVYILMDKMNTFRGNGLMKGIFRSCDIPLNYIYNQLESVQDPKLKANLLSQIALHHRRQAEQIDKIHHLEALPKWDRALKLYVESLKSDKNNLTAMLGYAKCLLLLNRYKLAEHYLIENRQKNPEFLNSAESWFLLGILGRKLQNYDEAIFALREAVSLGYNDIEVQTELNIVLKLKQETVTERIQFYKQMSTINAESNREEYNILSIDGGGIRGLIPAIWASELERRTGLNSCSMFHMMAGTSTGAIIAAGLSLPDKNNAGIPRYRAGDIVELYTAHSDKVFSNRRSMLNILGSSYNKYTDDGRKKLFDLYFENTKLSQTLTDLIIPAVRSGSSVTDLFRRSESLIDPSRNYKLADVLMCTTAAPTYFSPYKLENSVFVDGGVQANNPALLAYAEACRNRTNRDNIFVLSLGTGDYVPDPLHPNANRSLLFWLANKDSVLKVIFDGPQNNIDCQLHNMLGNEKYHRWQVWLEEPIALDDIKRETLNNLMELARAHFEEMDASDSNNRLGKLVERLKGSFN
jgi:predicted acylesterase/phospholipase RssA